MRGQTKLVCHLIKGEIALAEVGSFLIPQVLSSAKRHY